jgi:hypothetical protein
MDLYRFRAISVHLICRLVKPVLFSESAYHGTIIVTHFLGTVLFCMPCLVVLVAFLVLPVLLLMGAVIMAFSIATADLATTTYSSLL